jgi:hypothetical protein
MMGLDTLLDLARRKKRPTRSRAFLRQLTALTVAGEDWWEQRLRLNGEPVVLVRSEAGRRRDLWMPLGAWTPEDVRRFAARLAAAALDVTGGRCTTAGEVSHALADGAHDGYAAALLAAGLSLDVTFTQEQA